MVESLKDQLALDIPHGLTDEYADSLIDELPCRLPFPKTKEDFFKQPILARRRYDDILGAVSKFAKDVEAAFRIYRHASQDIRRFLTNKNTRRGPIDKLR